MSKDPAFLFYSSDFLTGTMLMTDEQVGVYIKLLCIQHQHKGIIDKESFNALVGTHEIVRKKFIESKEGFYNERLQTESKKRQAFCESRRKNIQKRYICSTSEPTLVVHMENENENIDKDTNKYYYKKKTQKKKIVKKQKIKPEIIEIINDLNEVLNTKYRPTTEEITKLIEARLKEGHTVEEFKQVHRNMQHEWENDDGMSKYLRPHTLYTGKFSSYLNIKIRKVYK